MTTTRRIDKTRKPPRRPPVRTAARMDDPAKSSEAVAPEPAPAEIAAAPLMSEIPAAEPLPAEHPAVEPLLAGTSTVAMLAAEAPVAAPVVTDTPETSVAPEEAEQTGDATTAESEASFEAATAETYEAPVSEAPVEAPATESVTEEPETEAPSAEDGPAEAPAFQDPELSEPVASIAPADAASGEQEPVPAADVQATAASAPADPAATPGRTGQEEIPLAAMQGFIEINGRLVAFFQGESQAALAFWKSALAARSPSDLAQLQAAEMSRAVDAAFACWTDLARRMGRLQAFTAPLARAA